MSKVVIERRQATYPDSEGKYAPSVEYPEYIWDDVSSVKNDVYDMVRMCLYRYGLDAEHFGTVEWNPLGDIISAGNCVVIKPNWVEEKNQNQSGGLDCLVTHASIIRAMIDYVHLALNGTGKIIVGDSPMPDCNLDSLMQNAHYNEIWESCRERGISVEIKDFREDIVTGFANEVEKTTGDSEVIIDMGSDSCFAETEQNNGGRYCGATIDVSKMNEYYHADGHHRYGINKTALEADVIINLPKPKTHRKAGYTAALKNYIGICSRKSSIPHTVRGNIKDGGDSYYGPKIIFETEQKMRDLQNKLQIEGKHIAGAVIKLLRAPFGIFRRLTHKRFFGTGNWYRNDTIWRSILDINRIMIYADKKGNLCNAPQRKYFSLGDMVIAGHRNGPLAPSPIHTGVVICSEDPVAFDLTVINIMGLNYDMLPVLNRIPKLSTYPIYCESVDKICLSSNDKEIDGKNVWNMPMAPYGFFEPADGWANVSNKH